MNDGGQVDWGKYLSLAVRSDVGMRRANNQDSYATSLAPSMARWKSEGHLFMVADGMGAHAAGELASKLAADHVVHLYRKQLNASPPEGLERAVRQANEEINRRGQENLDFHNMGTTCSVLLLLPQGALVGHVGDSRVYRLRGNRLHQLTFDHSLVWELREAGQIGADDPASGIPKNVITRSLGPHPNVRVDLEGPFPLEAKDTFLICSDGLTGCVTDTEIAAVLSAMEPDPAAQLLVDLANLRGGPDNTTVVVVRIESDEIASRNANTSPLRIGDQRNLPVHVPSYLWIITGVLWLAAVVMLAANFQLVAIILAALGAVALGGTLLWRSGALRTDGVKLSGGRKLGKGPYRDADAPPPMQFATELHRFVANVHHSATAQQWPLAEDRLQRTVEQATASLDRSQLTDAIVLYSDAIHQLQAAHRAHSTSGIPEQH